MEPEPHIGEDAELYAVGSLTAEERAAVDAHVANCSDCLRRVGEAEETVLALERGLATTAVPPLRRAALPPAWNATRWWPIPAIAAALIVGLLFPRPGPEQNPATLAMIRSHFSHAQFGGATGAPSAKVIYARDRSWYYVIVAGRHRYEVYGLGGGQSKALGTTRPAREASELFAQTNTRYDRLELRDGRHVVESALVR